MICFCGSCCCCCSETQKILWERNRFGLALDTRKGEKKNFKFRIRWCLLSSCTFFFLISFPYLMYIDTGQNDYSLCVCVKYGAFRFEFSFFFFNTQEKNLIC